MDHDVDDFPTMVVGESFYFKNFVKLFGRRGEDSIDKVVDARLEPDDFNEYDKNAVAVYIFGSQVGNLSREDARKYRKLIEEGRIPDRPLETKAYVRGGWDRGADDRGEFGVYLKFDLASEWKKYSQKKGKTTGSKTTARTPKTPPNAKGVIEDTRAALNSSSGARTSFEDAPWAEAPKVIEIPQYEPTPTAAQAIGWLLGKTLLTILTFSLKLFWHLCVIVFAVLGALLGMKSGKVVREDDYDDDDDDEDDD